MRARKLVSALAVTAALSVPASFAIASDLDEPNARQQLAAFAAKLTSHATPHRSVPSVTTVVDLGPTTFPVHLARDQAAMGTFTTVLRSKIGPAVKLSRPAGAWAGYQVSVMWMSHTALRLTLHPGVWTNYSSVYDPGFSRYWTTPAVLYPPRPFQVGLATTFNGGFRLATGDLRGGYWDYGGTAGGHGIGLNTGGNIVVDPLGRRSLTPGAESLVIYKDGSWAIGTWNGQVRMTSRVGYVRQELAPLIMNGRINPLTKSPDCKGNWGQTLSGSGCYQWRSGVGVTATGDLVYVSAHAVNPFQLAVILYQAGAINAMQLDINPQWMAAEYYTAGAGGAANPHVVYTHYYGPYHFILGSIAAGTAVNRDFFAAYLR